LRQGPIQSVEVSTIAHATEDPIKVDRALLALLQGINQQFTRHFLEGHHGNPIVKIETRLANDNANQFARLLIRKLPESERLLLLRDLELHSDDDGNLFIRVDKQKLLQGDFRMAEDDPVRVRIKFNRLIGDCKRSMMLLLETD